MKLYYVSTNGNPFVLADDGENRYTITSEDMLISTASDDPAADASEILGNIWQVGENDGWDVTDATFDELIDGCTVLASLDAEI